MFNRVLLHGSDIQNPNTTKAAAIKLVPRRLSKIIPVPLESVSKIVWLIFYKKVLRELRFLELNKTIPTKVYPDSQPEASRGECFIKEINRSVVCSTS